MAKAININCYEDVRTVLTEYGFSVHDLPLVGKNSDGESVILSACKSIEDGCPIYRLEAIQNNGWSRNTVFYNDGTIEEFYER